MDNKEQKSDSQIDSTGGGGGQIDSSGSGNAAQTASTAQPNFTDE